MSPLLPGGAPLPHGADLDPLLDAVARALRGPSALLDLARSARALGAAAARAGLSPDALFARVEDGLQVRFADALPTHTPAGAPLLGVLAFDALVLAAWGAARDGFHDTRVVLDAAARAARTPRGASVHDPSSDATGRSRSSRI